MDVHSFKYCSNTSSKLAKKKYNNKPTRIVVVKLKTLLEISQD